MTASPTRPRRALLIGALASTVVGLAGLAWGEPGEGLRLAARWTGRLGLVLFVPVFLGAGTRWVQAMSAFGASHLVHFGWLSAFIATSGIAPVPSRAAGGVLAYFILVSLVVVAWRAGDAGPPVAGAGRWLRRLGEPYLWIVFAMTYVARLRDPESLRLEPTPTHGVLLAVVVALLPARWILEWRRARVPRAVEAAR